MLPLVRLAQRGPGHPGCIAGLRSVFMGAGSQFGYLICWRAKTTWLRGPKHLRMRDHRSPDSETTQPLLRGSDDTAQ